MHIWLIYAGCEDSRTAGTAEGNIRCNHPYHYVIIQDSGDEASGPSRPKHSSQIVCWPPLIRLETEGVEEDMLNAASVRLELLVRRGNMLLTRQGYLIPRYLGPSE